MGLPIHQITIEVTEPRLLPPIDVIKTSTYPEMYELDAEITGPGMADGDTSGEGDAGGEGDTMGTRSYRLINFHVVYVEDSARDKDVSPTSTAEELQAFKPRYRKHPVGLLDATNWNTPAFSSSLKSL